MSNSHELAMAPTIRQQKRNVAGEGSRAMRGKRVDNSDRNHLAFLCVSACLGAALISGLAAPVWGQTAAPAAPAKAKTQTAAKAAAPAKPAAAPQRTFATPQDAKDALVDAAAAKDQKALDAIFGSDYEKLRTGDPTEDAQHLERFAAHIQEACTLEKVSEEKYTLFIGKHHFPFPIPIVKDGDKWRFDSAAGVEEILNRRIGEDELSAIMVCRVYALAQWEFFTQSGDHDNDGLSEYAQRFMSTPGKHDGLYWDTTPGQEPSPLGPLVAQARAEGYGGGQSGTTAQVKPVSQTTPAGTADSGAQSRHPYHGYYFKILFRQGPSAPGGAFSYLINGHMIAGFALVAYPEKWGNTGVMTFLINTQGRVYEKNLGPHTAETVAGMKDYNPDPTWKLAPRY